MSAQSPEFLCIGETMTLVYPEPSLPLEEASTFRMHIGGAESNTALYLANLGHSTGWVSRVGDDPFGRRMTSELQRFGVDTSAVYTDQNAPTAVYFKDPTPQGTTVHYYRRGSAASRMDATDIDRASFNGVRVVHLSGVTPGLSDSCASMVDYAIRTARNHGTLVSFDVNYRPGVWDVETASPVLADLSRRADVVFVGRDEAETLWGTATSDDIANYLKLSGSLIVKDGDVGATEFTDGVRTFAPAVPVSVVEPVGAGDAFAAGYLSRLVAGDSVASRLEHGHQLAARALSSLSDFNPLD